MIAVSWLNEISWRPKVSPQMEVTREMQQRLKLSVLRCALIKATNHTETIWGLTYPCNNANPKFTREMRRYTRASNTVVFISTAQWINWVAVKKYWYLGQSPRNSDLIGLICGLNFRICQSSPSDSHLQPRLKIAAVMNHMLFSSHR